MTSAPTTIHSSLRQLAAIIRVELLMSWRRGGLRAILLMAIILPPLFNIVMPLDRQIALMLAQLWPDDALVLRTAFAITNNAFVLVMTLFILPLMVSETIPLDAQYGVQKFMTALPVPVWITLAGKLLAFWAVVAASMALTAVISAALIWMQNGPLDIGALAFFWIGGLGLLALFSTQMGIMLAAGQKSRRQAILPGIAAVVLAIGAYFVLPVNDYLFNSLVISAVAANYPGRFSVAILRFPSPLDPLILLRIGAVIAVMIVVGAVTLRRLEHEFGHE